MAEVILLKQISQQDTFPPEYFEILENDHFWYQWRQRALLLRLAEAKIDLSTKLNVLDLGCGSGLVRQQLEQSTHWTIDGADLDYQALRSNPDLKGKCYLYDIASRDSSLQEKYDVILLFDVLEHIEDTRSFLANVSFHLKPGGHLLINVPAYQTLFSEYDKAVGHVMRYNKNLLKALLTDEGYIIATASYWGACLVPLLVIRKMMLVLSKAKHKVIKRGFDPPIRCSIAF